MASPLRRPSGILKHRILKSKASAENIEFKPSDFTKKLWLCETVSCAPSSPEGVDTTVMCLALPGCLVESAAQLKAASVGPPEGRTEQPPGASMSTIKCLPQFITLSSSAAPCFPLVWKVGNIFTDIFEVCLT